MFNRGRLAETDAGKFAWDGSDYVRLPADLTPAVTELIAAVERFRARPREERDGSVLRAQWTQDTKLSARSATHNHFVTCICRVALNDPEVRR